MKKYKTLYAMNVRPAPGDTSRRVASIPKGTEFWSDLQETRPGRQEWARMLNAEGIAVGWVCVFDAQTRYLEALPVPAPVIEDLPPVAENPGGMTPDATALAQRLERIESDIKRLFGLLKER
jgi:hypothetical protein